MGLFRCSTSSGSGGSGTPVTDWDYKYYASVSGATTWTVGYEPKRMVISFASSSARFTKLYDTSVSKTKFISYQNDGAKTEQNISDTYIRINNDGISFTSSASYSGVIIAVAPD